MNNKDVYLQIKRGSLGEAIIIQIKILNSKHKIGKGLKLKQVALLRQPQQGCIDIP